jgi:hypothetical protein
MMPRHTVLFTAPRVTKGKKGKGMAYTKHDLMLDLVMAYTTYDQSCRDPHITAQGELRECRLPTHHADDHASGYGPEGRRYWPQGTDQGHNSPTNKG